ncbi:MAG: hypothetical protein IPH33_10715 [Bacteroidetes bacterium]|nr:hypothetical protein [Bacteroidota bacterium]
MKTSTNVIIDNYAGGFVVFVLKNLSRIFNFRKSQNNGPLKQLSYASFLEWEALFNLHLSCKP